MLGAVGRIPKRGVNEFHGYQYVTEADLVDAIRPLLAAVGVVIVPSLIRHVYEPRASETRRGGALGRTYVEIDYTITDGISTIHFTMPGESLDDADKGVYKALTGSMKYALMKLMMVSTGDDPEGDVRVDREVRVEGTERTARRGGREEGPTPYQLQRISVTMREKGIPRPILVGAISQFLGEPEQMPDYESAEWQPWILAQLKRLSNEQAGQLVDYLDGLGNLTAGDDDAATPDA